MGRDSSRRYLTLDELYDHFLKKGERGLNLDSVNWGEGQEAIAERIVKEVAKEDAITDKQALADPTPFHTPHPLH